jgi:hypothetical protein
MEMLGMARQIVEMLIGMMVFVCWGDSWVVG